MTDRPIIFSAPMVRALLDGRKTQTRRLLKPAPEPFPIDDAGTLCDVGCMQVHGEAVHRIWLGTDRSGVLTTQAVRFGIGDRLYVREACLAEEFGDDCTDGVRYLADDEFVPIGNVSDASYRWLSLFHYGQKSGQRPSGLRGKGVPSIHMPRWASRLTLTVTDVRVQRVQEISEDDARAEGIVEIRSQAGDGMRHFGVTQADSVWPTAARAFRNLWDSLHAEPGSRWVDNPWIYALTFTVEDGNIDA